MLDQLGDLVDRPAVLRRPRAPLRAVDRPEIAALVRPLVPDAHAVLLQIAHVGVAVQEPQQLVHDRLQMQLLGRQQRKAVVESRTASDGRTPTACPCPCGRASSRRGAARVPSDRDIGASVEPGLRDSKDGEVYPPRQPRGRRLSTASHRPSPELLRVGGGRPPKLRRGHCKFRSNARVEPCGDVSQDLGSVRRVAGGAARQKPAVSFCVCAAGTSSAMLQRMGGDRSFWLLFGGSGCLSASRFSPRQPASTCLRILRRSIPTLRSGYLPSLVSPAVDLAASSCAAPWLPCGASVA